MKDREARRERQAELSAQMKRQVRGFTDTRPRVGGMLATAKLEGPVDYAKLINMKRVPVSGWPTVFMDDDGDLATKTGKLKGVDARFENQDAHTAWTFTRIVVNTLSIFLAVITLGISLLFLRGRKSKGYGEIRLDYTNGRSEVFEVDAHFVKHANRWVNAIKEYNDELTTAA